MNGVSNTVVDFAGPAGLRMDVFAHTVVPLRPLILARNRDVYAIVDVCCGRVTFHNGFFHCSCGQYLGMGTVVNKPDRASLLRLLESCFEARSMNAFDAALASLDLLTFLDKHYSTKADSFGLGQTR